MISMLILSLTGMIHKEQEIENSLLRSVQLATRSIFHSQLTLEGGTMSGECAFTSIE